MKILAGNLLAVSVLSLFFTQVTAKTVSETSFFCEEDKFKCSSQKCIPDKWKCDGDDDCGDGSDEVNCHLATCKPNEFTCKNKKCIPKKWACDSEADCSDGSDENNCPKPTCKPDSFHCNNSRCVQKKWKCDGHDDCGDNSDEASCGDVISTCKSSEFKCGNGACIFKLWACDGENDCQDGSDEKNCKKLVSECDPNEFRCTTNHCIPNKWRCDGANDCHNGADEKNCSLITTNKPVKVCAAKFWQCQNGDCIKKEWKCDGENDCSDGSDEQACDQIHCHSTKVSCKNGRQCIFSSHKCNGVKDCDDGSDEENCEKPRIKCGLNHFNCSDGSCINISEVCNLKRNCPHWEDEPANCFINECLSNNAHCMHTCTDLKIGYKCSCKEGYELAADRKTCNDVNECKIYSSCHQTCTNTKGHFKCACASGYVLGPDMKSCKALGVSSWVYFANRHDIRKMLPNVREYTIEVTNQSGVVSFDFDINNNHIYWSDIKLKKIQRAVIGKHDSIKTIVDHVHTPDGLAFDWIGGKLYWTDTGYKTIEVSDLYGHHNADLVKVGLAEPRAIALNPHEGFLYWTDWGESAAIEKISMDGAKETRVKIVTVNIVWPNGLSIDLAQKRIYWIDAKLKRIESTGFNGENRVLLREGGFSHPFALDAFEDMLYWTDWKLDGVVKMSKFNTTITPVQLELYAPMDVKVWHPMKQIKERNPCGANNYGCSHLCLLANHFGRRTVVCKCPRNMTLDKSKKKCKGIPATRGPKSTATKKVPTTVTIQSTYKKVTKSKSTQTRMTSKKSSKLYTTASTTRVPVVNPQEHAPRTADLSSNMSAGTITAIVISVIIALIILLFLVFYFKRRHVGKNHVMYYKDMSTMPLEEDFDVTPNDLNDKAKIITHY